MANEDASIFNKKATEQLRTPDDLDKYLKVTTPSVWLVLFACLALLVGLLAWGVFGTVSTSITTTGVSLNGKTYCFLKADVVAEISIGNDARVDGYPMKVAYVSPHPLSRDEVNKSVGNEYLTSALMDDDWAYSVILEGSDQLDEYVPLTVVITTETVPPISLILGGAD